MNFFVRIFLGLEYRSCVLEGIKIDSWIWLMCKGFRCVIGLGSMRMGGFKVFMESSWGLLWWRLGEVIGEGKVLVLVEI